MFVCVKVSIVFFFFKRWIRQRKKKIFLFFSAVQNWRQNFRDFLSNGSVEFPAEKSFEINREMAARKIIRDFISREFRQPALTAKNFLSQLFKIFFAELYL